MRPTDRFTLRRAHADDARSELWSSGAKLPALVPGTHLEAQYLVGAASEPLVLLVTSYNLPYEEMLHVLLLDDRGTLLECVEMGAPYAPGILEHLRVLSADSLGFEFQGPVVVTVHPKPRGWWRRKRLQVTRSNEARGIR
jgi:hypothetical protein